MNIAPLGLVAAPLAASVPAQRAQASSGQLLTACRLCWENDGRLVALWGSDERDRHRGFLLRVVLEDRDGLTLLEHTLPDDRSRYPDLSPIFPAANRMQRAMYDLLGIAAESDDQRPWLWTLGHSTPASVAPGRPKPTTSPLGGSEQGERGGRAFPLRRDFKGDATMPTPEDYAFVRVDGEGVHEIPVGPVHAGIIEPGHFRFQVVGEKVLRLEERLGYTHKGVEKRFEAMSIDDGAKLVGRVSGDSTVAYAWAYAEAVERCADFVPPARARWIRALCLERERLANHLGDIGAIGNDAGFAFGLAQFSRLREDVLRMNQRAFGHRLMMDAIVPGGLARDLEFEHVHAIHDEAERIALQVVRLREIYDEHAGVQDRFRNAGRATPALAREMGLVGLAGRASGQAHDIRYDFPSAPYDLLDVRMALQTAGDVWARVAVRFDEVLESARLIGIITAALLDPATMGSVHAAGPSLPADRLALGYVEGWRGPVLVAVEIGEDNTLRRCRPQDPSWTNWPVVEHATIGNIVPDFPLINKSFNLSYSGQDL
ncbi:MAG TPA: NADH-quinone oxidoreductase subunit C [Casimicrobiaceae bacterium]|nr:NADH-quinone oxidoreductase subunit C [Casimicrobiaceae bacterium]